MSPPPLGRTEMDNNDEHLPVVIPNSIYNEALAYFPKSIVDDLFTVTDREHAGVVATRDVNKVEKYSEETKLYLLHRYHHRAFPKFLIGLPIVLAILICVVAMFMGKFTPYVLFSVCTMALLATNYLISKYQYMLEQQKYANALLRYIDTYTSREIIDRYRKYNLEAARIHESVSDLCKIENNELRVRYEGMINYFYQVDPQQTDEYINSMSSSPIFIVPHETIQ